MSNFMNRLNWPTAQKHYRYDENNLPPTDRKVYWCDGRDEIWHTKITPDKVSQVKCWFDSRGVQHEGRSETAADTVSGQSAAYGGRPDPALYSCEDGDSSFDDDGDDDEDVNNTVQLTSLVSNTASLRFTDATSGGGRNMPRRPDNSRPPSVRSYDPESLAPQSQRLDLSDEPAGRRTGLEFSSAGCALWGGSIAQQPHCAGLWLPVSRELLNTLQDADNRFSYLLKLMDETQSKVVSVISVWSFLNFVECNDLKLLEILGNDNGFYIKHRAKLDNFDFGEMNDLYKILELRHDERAEQEEDCGITLNDMRLISRLKLFQECLRYRAGQKSLIIKTAQKMGLVTTHAALLRVAESDLELKLLLLNMYFHKVYVIQALSFYNWLEKHIKSSKISAIDFKNLRPSCPKGRCQLKLVSISNLFLKCFFDSESFQFTKDPVTGRIRRNKKVIYCDECQSRATNSEFKWKFNFRKQEIQPVPETVFYFHCGTHHYDICTKCAKEKTNPSAGCHNQNRRY